MHDDSMAALRGALTERLTLAKADRNWFCILSENRIDLYFTESDLKPGDSFLVDDIYEVSFTRALNRPCFQVTFLNKDVRVFSTQSVPEAERWICALSHRSPTDKVNIDSFEVIRPIGRGSFGDVSLARKRGTDDLFAIKAIRKDQVKESVKSSRVLAERNVLMHAQHQFLTHLHYSFQSESSFYLALEFVAGGDLYRHLEAGVEFSPYQVQLYLAEIVVALRTLHKLGVIYRDLKPENILLDENGHIKLADFGLSRQIEKESAERYSLCGTQEYIPPEMLREEAQTFAVDWWALGILAYRLMVGYLPFQHRSPRKLFDRILKLDVRIPASLSQKHPNGPLLIKNLLEKNPSHRLGSPGTDITAHPYFAGVSWNMVAKMQYEPEFKPDVPETETVVTFAEVETGEPSMPSRPGSDAYVTVANFSFQAESTFPSLVSFDDLAAVSSQAN
jgi:serine/threonine protein kinase